MKYLLLVPALLFATAAAPASACEGDKDPTVKVTLKEAQKSGATFVDANSKQTRAKFGVIPGAVLLTSFDAFKSKELPKNKDEKLVFYCANQWCGASKQAAARATMAGYKNVAVLPDGIQGWKKAGLKTVPLAKAAKPAKKSSAKS